MIVIFRLIFRGFKGVGLEIIFQNHQTKFLIVYCLPSVMTDIYICYFQYIKRFSLWLYYDCIVFSFYLLFENANYVIVNEKYLTLNLSDELNFMFTILVKSYASFIYPNSQACFSVCGILLH